MQETTEYKGYKIRIEQDRYPMNPMEDWDWEEGIHFQADVTILDGEEIPELEYDLEPWDANVYGLDYPCYAKQDYIFQLPCGTSSEDLDQMSNEMITLQDCVNCKKKMKCSAHRDWREENLDYWQERKEQQDFFDSHTVLRVYKYDHSGVAYNTTGFSCSWDSGQVGYISIPNSASIPDPKAYLESLVETYSCWANGDVYGYTVEAAEGEEIDSCWGFYGEYGSTGWNYMLSEAEGAVDHHIKQIWKARKESVKQFNL